ncbi:hypothetical protein DR64_3443 [Paraburkholderia xenovorans LB400]|uniref:hypothetical protein n=1 Tax=Paraburkholderia xenovorans TaxID=36873 RepID=UPI0003050E35|nr:hypothetical protein [Paraburkholderia xenovorans]AIP33146.1 hypothetical protein DR64_3443 [Paraburkholderia xenovorans LB400]
MNQSETIDRAIARANALIKGGCPNIEHHRTAIQAIEGCIHEGRKDDAEVVARGFLVVLDRDRSLGSL